MPNWMIVARSLIGDLADYFALLDWTGRICREDKRGYITSDLPPILHCLGIDPDQWLRSMQPKGLVFTRQ